MREGLFPREEGHPKMPPKPLPQELAATAVSAVVVPVVSTATAGIEAKSVTAEEEQQD